MWIKIAQKSLERFKFFSKKQNKYICRDISIFAYHHCCSWISWYSPKQALQESVCKKKTTKKMHQQSKKYSFPIGNVQLVSISTKSQRIYLHYRHPIRRPFLKKNSIKYSECNCTIEILGKIEHLSRNHNEILWTSA